MMKSGRGIKSKYRQQRAEMLITNGAMNESYRIRWDSRVPTELFYQSYGFFDDIYQLNIVLDKLRWRLLNKNKKEK